MAYLFNEDSINLWDANGWYTLDGGNFGFNWAHIALTSTQYIYHTFVNNADCRGFWALINCIVAAGTDRSVSVELQQGQTVTISNATPCVVTLVSHWLATWTAIQFTTTWALPAPLVVNTVYYMRSTWADTMNLYTTYAAAINLWSTAWRINTTNAWSWVHTLWVTRTSKTHTSAELYCWAFSTQTNWQLEALHYWKFDTPYAVTTVTTWRFKVAQQAGTNNWNIKTSNWTAHSYFTWVSTKRTFSDWNDAWVLGNYCDFNVTHTNSYFTLGTGETVYYYSGLICANKTDTTRDWNWFYRVSNPAWNITITSNQPILISGRSGCKFWTSTTSITKGRVLWNFWAPPSGSARYAFVCPLWASTTAYYDWLQSVVVYSEHPVKTHVPLIAKATVGDSSISVNAADVSDWSWTQVMAIWSLDVIGAGSYTTYTATSIVWGTINLWANIANYDRLIWGRVQNHTDYWVKFVNTTTATQGYVFLVMNPSIVYIDWVCAGDAGILYTAGSIVPYVEDIPAVQRILKNSCCYATNSTPVIWNYHHINSAGTLIDNCAFHRLTPCYYSVDAYKNTGMVSGYLSLNNVSVIGSWQYVWCYDIGNVQFDVDYLYIENSAYSWMGNCLNSTFDNCYFFGITNYWFWVDGFKNTIINNMYIDKCWSWIWFLNSYDKYNKEVTFNNVVRNSRANNTTDLITTASLNDVIFNSPVWLNTATTTNNWKMDSYTDMRFTNVNWTTNNDFVWKRQWYLQRCWTGLTDTTALTGSDYSLRFNSMYGSYWTGENLDYDEYIPIWDMTGKPLVVSTLVQINNAAYYWVALYQLPRITITYDWTTTTYAEALANTNVQTLSKTITPTTSTPRIKVTYSSLSNTANNSVYFWEVQIKYPPFYKAKIGDKNYWKDALPLQPSNSIGRSMAEIQQDNIQYRIPKI